METLKKLPIGEQSFEKLRRENKLYVDKTEYVYRMAQDGTHYFLSRPRRFGKSLLLSTIEAYFLGQRELFEGLYVASQEKDWFVHPVMHLDFSAQSYTSEEKLYNIINNFLLNQEAIFGSKPGEVDLGLRFEGVIRRAYEQTGRGVVILVDEYDKPLLHAIDKPEQQDVYREMLRGFYGALKSMNKYIRFAFLTGITKFSKVSVFSDLNNLNDISRDRAYANICGLTDAEVDRDLVSYIQAFAAKNGKRYEEVRGELRKMYDGYHFVDNTDGLYNPFSIMCALSKGELGNYWFETGTPTMLVEMLRRKQYKLEALEGTVGVSTLDNRTGRNDNVIALLYQSGYLSIAGASADKQTYRLEFPNEEVRSGFFQFLLPYYAQVQGDDTASEIGRFLEDVRGGRVEQFLHRLTALFAGFQYDAQKDTDTEEHFRNVLFVLFRLLGLKVKAEYMTSDGRIDLLVTTDKFRYVIECKMDSTARVALEQIKRKEYGLKWVLDEKETMLIGLNFSSKKRRPDGWIATNSKGGVIAEYQEEGAGERKLTWVKVRKMLKERGIKLSENQEIVLKAIVKKPSITQEEISISSKVPLATVYSSVTALQDKGVLGKRANRKAGQWQILL